MYVDFVQYQLTSHWKFCSCCCAYIPPNNPLLIPPVVLGELGQVVNVLPGAVDVMVTTCGVLPPLNNPLLSEEHDMTVVVIFKVLVGAGKMLDNADGILMILLLLIGTADNAAV